MRLLPAIPAILLVASLLPTAGCADDASTPAQAGCLDVPARDLRSKTWGEPGKQRMLAGRVASGVVAFGGWFEGSLDLGGEPLLSAGDRDGFVAAFDEAGNPLFQRRVGGAGRDEVRAVAIGADGSVVAAGTCSDDCGGAAKTAYLMKLDAAGALLWERSFEGDVVRVELALSPGGDVLVGAQVRGAIDLGGGVLPDLMDPQTEFSGQGVIARFDPSGKHLWSRFAADQATAIVGALAFDDTGAWMMSCGKCAADKRSMVMRFGAGDQPIWAATLDRGFQSIAATPDGGVVGGGWFTDTIVIGDDVLESVSQKEHDGAYGYDALLVGLDPGGSPRYAVRFGGLDDDAIHAVSATPSGGSLIAGEIDYSSSSYWGAAFPGRGFVAEFDASGERLWQVLLPEGEPTQAIAMGPVDDGGIVVLGHVTQGGQRTEYDTVLLAAFLSHPRSMGCVPAGE